MIKCRKMSKGVSIISLFKYRVSALGCGAFLIMLYISFYLTVKQTIVVGSIFILASFICYSVYFLTKRKSAFDIFIKISCATLFIILAIIISFFTFQKDKELYSYCDGNDYQIEARVNKVLFNKSYYAGYEVSINKIDGEEYDITAVITDDSGRLTENDIFSGTVAFSAIHGNDIGFNAANYYRDDGILIEGEIKEYASISQGKRSFKDTLRDINRFLDNIIKTNFDEKSYPIISALLLGNRELLSRDINRDFTRLGIVHILSLSGMHVSIIVAMLGFALSKTFLPSSSQFAIMTAIIVIFVGMSGFSEPAIRAGLMQILFFVVYIFWRFPDKVTVLFVSVTLICIFSPYLVFSLSLILSFLAMLGCMLSARLLYKSKAMYNVRSKLLRFCILTFTTTCSVTFLCLPLTYLYFGSFSLASFLANLLLVPIINIVIYLVPITLLILPIRFISNVLIYLCEVICSFVLDISSYVADFKNLLLPITNDIQLIGSILLFAAVMTIFILPRKHLKISLCIFAVSLIIFSVGTASLFINRNNNTYICAYSHKGNDAVCIEESNKITIIDISSHSKSTVLSSDMSKHLGYGEVSEYVILTYSASSSAYFDKMTGDVVIRHIYLASPQNEAEEKYFNACIEILESKDIEYSVFSGDIQLGSFTLDMNEEIYLDRSTKRCVAFTLTNCNFKYSYFGASTFEMLSEEISKRIYESDVIYFGSYGPIYKKSFKYDRINAKHCIFTTDSLLFADRDFLNEIENTYVIDKPFVIRIEN